MKLLALLPEDYRKSPAVVELMAAIEQEGSGAEDAVEDLAAQLFLDTATWGLSHWERMYGVERQSTDAGARKSAVRAKMRGAGTTTVALLKRISESFVNGEVEVTEHNAEYRFTIDMVSIIGIPPNLEDLKRAIEESKPAHLAYDIRIKYNTWGMVREANVTWGAAAGRTWKQWKEVKITNAGEDNEVSAP